MSPPHIGAEPGDFAKTVLMSGDPLRAKFVAENYLTDVKCVNEIRGMLGYTGKYEGKEVSVMGHGMGIPSICIYTYELYNFFDVDNIIRIGTAGALQDSIRARDLIFAVGAHYDSTYGQQYGLVGCFCPTATYSILERAVNKARERGVRYHVGNVFSTDIFYSDTLDRYARYRDFGTLAAEMETSGLYMNAADAGKNALSILSVSDHLFRKDNITPEERQTTLTDMIEIALQTAVEL
ncbi:purine-nucleoside phosphorylase [Butyrivibrio sp. INlla16]|uniref:purine-nucleoside phosphorylase n=1 Tax=Butyrivibrio sp. INlla16 TaxID=1520807 RepID=UPI000889A5BE|nr:purine-nucleoside phosphorylase [Butyrivibrio sp. INlla16]SDB24174.1 purine-nucleoside phosphorylase [Butyrivibrio sp. INlla16]